MISRYLGKGAIHGIFRGDAQETGGGGPDIISRTPPVFVYNQDAIRHCRQDSLQTAPLLIVGNPTCACISSATRLKAETSRPTSSWLVEKMRASELPPAMRRTTSINLRRGRVARVEMKSEEQPPSQPIEQSDTQQQPGICSWRGGNPLHIDNQPHPDSESKQKMGEKQAAARGD